MPDAPVYRCFDDRCRVRTTCRWWHRRNERHGQVAMTWRLGYEDPNLPCAQWAPEETHERCVTYE